MALNDLMAEALRLTRAGDLTGATALLQGGHFASSPATAPAPASGTIDSLPLQATNWSGRAHSVPESASGTGSSEWRRHVGAAGSIDYLLYRPANVAPGMPLIIMLHGCTQTPDNFALGTRMNEVADERGFIVAYPRQTAAANPQKCWNWFKPGDQQRGRGEPALIAGLTQDIIAAEWADSARVYVAGLSAGGAAAAIMADAYPDLFAAVGIHSGLACGAARDLPSALTAMKRGSRSGAPHVRKGMRFVPVITFHGDRDLTVAEVNARDIVAVAAAAASTALTVEIVSGEAAGRRYTRALSRDASGAVLIEQWTVAGAAHAWSGGSADGSYADPGGPDASRAMARFFLSHSART